MKLLSCTQIVQSHLSYSMLILATYCKLGYGFWASLPHDPFPIPSFKAISPSASIHS
ncbi:hypothetical protein K445DRAFT_197482 [Daldinia sp. EC12]|nr:hypothetical protein F4774DRAFT_305200 [Daldinia eschscholtzii]OTB19539.1 hypothetical protein K445DRAFT_197482 [Daldinia sp. EC12]